MAWEGLRDVRGQVGNAQDVWEAMLEDTSRDFALCMSKIY